MRILYVATSSALGGGNQSLISLARGMTKAGDDVTVLVPGEGRMLEACRGHGLMCQAYAYDQPSGRHLWRSARQQVNCLRLLKRLKIDVVHANDPRTARLITAACRMARTPLVCHLRFPLSRNSSQWVFRRLPKPAAFVFNSRALKQEVGDNLARAAPKSKQHVIHNAVDCEQFHPSESTTRRVPRIGIIANLMPVKGHEYFLQMARLLKHREIAAEFRIIGDDIHGAGRAETLKALAETLDVRDCVSFLGHCTDMPRAIQELDIVVCASTVEPFGRCLIEAMACGKPVVGTRVGGIPEVIGEEQESGHLVPPRSAEALADAVETLIQGHDLRARMGRAARQRVEQYFSLDSHVAQLRALYIGLKVDGHGSSRQHKEVACPALPM